jgi:hypothetical protein
MFKSEGGCMRFLKSYCVVTLLLIGILCVSSNVYAGGGYKSTVEFKGHGTFSKLTSRFNVRLIIVYDDQQLMDETYSNTKQLKSVTAYNVNNDGKITVTASIYDEMYPSYDPVKSRTWKQESPQGRYQFHMKSDANAPHGGNWEFNLDMVCGGNTVDMYCE